MGLIQHTVTLQGMVNGSLAYAATNMVEYRRMALMAGLEGELVMEPDDTHVEVGHEKTLTATFTNSSNTIPDATAYIVIGYKVVVMPGTVYVNGILLDDEEWKVEGGTMSIEVGEVPQGDTVITFRTQVLPH